MKKIYFFILIAFGFTFTDFQANAQEFNAGADIMSRYVWRGRDYGNSPSIQPTLEYSIGGFTVGTWGAFSIGEDVYQEHDLYVSYSVTDFLSVGVTDYFFPAFPVDDITFNNKYFDYGDETGHVVEFNLGFDGVEAFPIAISANVAFFGADKDEEDEQIMSTYIEASYSNKLKDYEYTIFAGFTPNSEMSLYSDKAALVNLGLTVKKEVKISESFSLPVQTSFITNPNQENIYFVFGFSL